MISEFRDQDNITEQVRGPPVHFTLQMNMVAFSLVVAAMRRERMIKKEDSLDELSTLNNLCFVGGVVKLLTCKKSGLPFLALMFCRKYLLPLQFNRTRVSFENEIVRS